jgi:nucleoside phosphorylase
MKSARYRAVILTATDEEYKEVRRHLDESNIKQISLDDSPIYEQSNFRANDEVWDIAIAQIEQRNVNAAVVAERAIQNFRPKIILFVGTAGSMHPSEVKIGDVVVATKAYEYESGKYENGEFYPRPDSCNSSPSLIRLAKLFNYQDEWKQRTRKKFFSDESRVHVGPVASGSAIIASTSAPWYEIIKKIYGHSLAVEMEGFGFLKAAEHKKVHAAVIRGISDFCEEKYEAEKEGSKEIAMVNASAVALELIEKFSSSQKPSMQNRLQPTDTVVTEGITEFVTWGQAWDEYRSEKSLDINIEQAGWNTQLNDLRSILDNSAIRAILIIGPPNAGKYGLALEATKNRKNKTVVATDSKSIAVRDLSSLESQYTDVVIIEDPDPEKVGGLVKQSLRSNKFKLLLTLSTEADIPDFNFGTDSRVKIIKFTPFSKQEVQELLDSTGAKFDKRATTRIVELADGDPDILLAVATLGAGLTKGGTNVSKKLIDSTTKEVALLSLLTDVGVKGPAYKQLELICAEFGGRLRPTQILRDMPSLEIAGIVRSNGPYAQVLPRVFANRLAESVLSNRFPKLLNLFYKLDPNGKSQLINRLKTFRSEETDRFWDELFSSGGLFKDLQSALFYNHLLYPAADAAPIRVARLIEDGLKDTSINERKLINSSAGRELVTTLQKLRLHRKISVTALRCLALLAETDTEDWSNDANAVFCDCFFPAHPQFPLSLNARFEVLNKFFSIENSVELHLIALEAINCAFSIHPVMVPLSLSSEVEPFDPQPKITQGKILDYLKGLIDLLIKIAQNEETSLAKSALDLLPQASVQWAIQVLRLTSPIARLKTLIERLKALVEWTKAGKPISVFNLDDALRHIHHMLNEDIKKRDETSNTESKAAAGLRKCSEQVKQLINELDQADFTIRVKKLADSVWAVDETGPQALAKEVIADPTRLTDDLIEWLCSEEVGWGSFAFFRELGKLDSAHQFTKRIEQVGTQQKGIDAFANYFEGLSQIDKKFVTKLLNEFTEKQSVTADAIVAATGRFGYDPAGYQRIEKLLRENKANPLVVMWAIRSPKWRDQLNVDECSRLMKLVAGPNLQNAVAVIDYLVFWSSKRSITGELADLAWQCLEAMPSIKTDQSHQSYNFDELAALLAQADITRAYTLLKNLLEQPDKRHSWDPLSILGGHQFWNVLWEYDRERTLRFVLEIVLSSPLGYQIIWDLRDIIDQDQSAELLIKVALESEKKAELICQCLTGCIKTTSKFWSIAFRIIDQYPKNKGIKNILTLNVGPSGGWVEEMFRDFKNCLKEVEDLRGDAKTPKSALPWLKQVDSYIRGEISRWKSSDEYEL